MKTACIVGLGYVGLPLACLCVDKGLNVYGIDIDKEKIDLVKKGISPIDDLKLKEKVSKINGKIKLSTDISEGVTNSDVIIICVPTPIDENYTPDLRPLESACEAVSKALKKGSIVIIESTIFPGTVEEIVLPILKKSGLKTEDFFLAHCPERIDPGNKKYDISNLPRVVAGVNKESTKKAADFYRKIINAEITELSSVKAAEATKIMENTFRDINIAFVNEMAKSFDKAGIDITEVLRGAATKPFAFMPHYPGAGVGGHCFDKNEKIFIKNNNYLKVKKIGKYIDSLKCKKQFIQGTEILSPQNLKALSFDMRKNKTVWKTVTICSKRKCNNLLNIKCHYNYSLKVTDMHPVICYDKGLKVKFAKDLVQGDKLVLNKILPEKVDKITINMIEHLDKDLNKKLRIKPRNTRFSKFKEIIDQNLKGNKRDYYRDNSLPLSKYLELEKLLNIKRKDIWLCTGRGPSFKKFPAIIDIDKDFLRLIGYYLSEGCITKDKSLRVRFTFNTNEKEYIRDLKDIIKKIGLDYSVYQSKVFDSYTIKVSSELFGFLIKSILKCGTNCYNMKIPEQFIELGKTQKEEILKGIFRGDGGVTLYYGRRKYSKNNKVFEHLNNSISVSYFTSSSILFQQVMLLLLNQDIVPSLTTRKGYLNISGPRNIQILKNWFLGEKTEKIKNYLKNMTKVIRYKNSKRYKDFITVDIKEISKAKTDYVYSLEVDDTHTLISSNGIIAHNCIKVDPYYLIAKAKQLGFNHRFVSLAREINESMPKYVVKIFEEQLEKISSKIKDAKIGIMGVSYKSDVDDIRESPALKIIEILEKKNSELFIYDPHNKEKSNVDDLDELMQKSDYIILITDHQEFKEMNLEDLKKNKIKIVIDGRNCLDKHKIKRMGIAYHGIGRA